MTFQIVFLGSPEFAAVSLQKLIEARVCVRGVVTMPDRPKGRKMVVCPTPVRLLAQKHLLPVITPQDVNAPDALNQIRGWRPDVIVVAAFGQILHQPLLDMPRLGCINVHPSLLPLYRGASPIRRAIMDGQAMTGVTICKMVRKLDSGDILLTRSHAIGPQDNFGILHDRLAAMGADILVEALQKLEAGTLSGVPQNDAGATYAPKITKEEESIQWNWPAGRIQNLVRALDPAPGASAILAHGPAGLAGVKQKEGIKIWSVEAALDCSAAVPDSGSRGTSAAQTQDDSSSVPVAGTIVEVHSKGLRVAAGEGSLWIKTIQPVSKSRMDVSQWLLGHAVSPGDRFE